MRFGLMALGVGMLGVGTMAQQSGSLYDLGEAMKPIEEMGNGVAKAGTAVVNAAIENNPLPTWLLAMALIAFVIRVFFVSQTSNSVVQGRNERQQQEHAIAMAKLQHEQEMEKLRFERELREAREPRREGVDGHS